MEQCGAPVGWLQPLQETSCALSQVADTEQPKRQCASQAFFQAPLLHADRVDSAAGCISQTCKAIVTARSAKVS